MPDLQTIPTRTDRFIRAWSLIWVGFFAGFLASAYWMEHWHPNELSRSLVYRFLYPAAALLSFAPATLLAIYRGIQKHAALEQQMASRTTFTPEPQPPASDPESI